MGSDRTTWHIGFVDLLSERGPADFEVRGEVQLSTGPQRADLLLLRRKPRSQRRPKARVLRRLWDLLGTDSIVEFKSLTRPLRRGDAARLLGYAGQYLALQVKRPLAPRDLSLVLVVPSITPSLRAELAWLGWTIAKLGGGYYRLRRSMYASFLAVIDEVAVEEADDLLGSFGHLPITTVETSGWWQRHLFQRKDTDMRDLPGFDEAVEKYLASFPLTKRLVGIAPERQVLALSDEVLRGFPDEYLRSLPPDVQKAIRARIGRPAPARSAAPSSKRAASTSPAKTGTRSAAKTARIRRSPAR